MGSEVWVKAEGLQRTGSFKFRGAYNAVSVACQQGARAIAAYSSGNHAAAVAEAGRLHKVPVTVLMPLDAPAAKVAAAQENGAVVRRYDRYRDDRYALAEELAQEQGATLVPSADSVHVIAGAATAVLELLEDSGALDLVIVPVGGGGLLAGASCVLPAATMLLGVEPVGSDDLNQSLRMNRLVSVDIGTSEADGLLLSTVAPTAWHLVAERARATIVDEAALITAMRVATDRLRIVAEPSAVAGLAALMSMPESFAGMRIGIVMTGANVGHQRLARLLQATPTGEAARLI